MLATLNPVKIIMIWRKATPMNKNFGKPTSKKIPKINGLRAAPKSMPE
jgi:hypothetical protein